MKYKRYLLSMLIPLLFPPALLSAQSLRLAQVDPSRLLTRQEVDLYVGLTDAVGDVPPALGLDAVRVEESVNGVDFREVPVVDIEQVAALDHGITFLLLVDNSGSMYQTIAGQDTENREEMRIASAKAAIRDFLDGVDVRKDRVALASFNTNYLLHTPPTSDPDEIAAALETIQQPDSDDAYTELYRAIALAADDLADVAGRKVILVLSDGENFPFSVHADRAHPLYGNQLVEPDEAIRSIQDQSTGAFAINFATAGDESLLSIVTQTGGLLFDAADEEELARVYSEIRNRILDEYRITYRPEVLPGRTRIVRVTYLGGLNRVSAERRYFTATILGVPGEAPWYLYLLPLLAGLLLALLTALLRFRNSRTLPNLEVLDARGKSTQVLDITAAKTIIGSSAEADVTLANAPSLKESHATIVYDQSTKSYTVVSDEPIGVNNQRTSKRRLEPGDVIQLPGSTIVFDIPEEEEKK